jgi:hypothetical protein
MESGDDIELAAAARAGRQLLLAADPDHGGRVTPATLQEAHVILALEEARELAGPVRRSAGRGDCTDANGQDWDVKRYRDDVTRPPFDIAVVLEDIRFEVMCGENVILDLTGLRDRQHRSALRQAVETAGLEEHVRWYE